jgi:hypothetical protein
MKYWILLITCGACGLYLAFNGGGNWEPFIAATFVIIAVKHGTHLASNQPGLDKEEITEGRPRSHRLHQRKP